MSRSFLVIATVCTTALTALTSTAHAQLVTAPNKPFSFGAALGASIPVSDLSDAVNTGFNATGILGLHTPSLPMDFRIDLAYNEFGFKQASGNYHNLSVTGNAVFTFQTANPSSIRPYLIGGVGLYNSSTSASGSSSSNDFGFNVGGGITIPLSGFNAFVEARYNRIATSDVSTQFIPITVGVMF